MSLACGSKITSEPQEETFMVLCIPVAHVHISFASILHPNQGEQAEKYTTLLNLTNQ